MESLRPLHKARFTDVLDYGILLFKKHFKKILLLNLMFYLPFHVLLALINPMFSDQYWAMLDPYQMMEAGSMFSSILTVYAMLFGSFLLTAIYSLTFQNVMDGSVIKMVYADVVLNQEKKIKQVIKECFSQFWSLMLGRLLFGLILYAVVFVAYLLLIAGIFGGTGITLAVTAANYAVAPWLSVVILILGVIVGLAALFFIGLVIAYFFGKYWMFLPGICIERQKAGASFGRCGNLGKNSFYLISLSCVMGGLLVALIPSLANTVVLIVASTTGTFDLSLLGVGSVATQLVTALLQPLFTCILTALYITLRVRREGLDMEVALWTMKEIELEKNQRWTAEAIDANRSQ